MDTFVWQSTTPQHPQVSYAFVADLSQPPSPTPTVEIARQEASGVRTSVKATGNGAFWFSVIAAGVIGVGVGYAIAKSDEPPPQPPKRLRRRR